MTVHGPCSHHLTRRQHQHPWKEARNPSQMKSAAKTRGNGLWAREVFRGGCGWKDRWDWRERWEEKRLCQKLCGRAQPVISGTLSDKTGSQAQGPTQLAGPLKRFTGWRSVGTNVRQRECGADITSPWPWGKEDISDRLLWRHVPRTHDVSSRQCQLTPAPPRVHYLLLLPPSLHGFCFYSLYTWQSNRSRKHSQLRMALLHLHQEIWQPPLHILTSSKPEDAGFLTYPQETTGGSGGQNIPSTGCLSLFWFDITSFCKVSNHSHWKCVHWGHSQTLTLKREKWAQSWVLRAESLVPIIYHKVPNA